MPKYYTHTRPGAAAALTHPTVCVPRELRDRFIHLYDALVLVYGQPRSCDARVEYENRKTKQS